MWRIGRTRAFVRTARRYLRRRRHLKQPFARADQLAIDNYRTALKLDPDNDNARQMLDRLGADTR